MPSPARRQLELNELAWWSNWATLRWLNRDAHVLTSKEFREPFFNRAGFLTCRTVAPSLVKVEACFKDARLRPTVLLQDSCSSGIRTLARAGYATADKMSVMAMERPEFRTNDAVTVKRVGRSGVSTWSRAYLRSFYGNDRLFSKVSTVVARLVGRRGVTLLEGLMGGAVAGVLAIQRTRGLAGVYCVGTVPQFRRRGVSGTLISAAEAISSREGRQLILQTLESDGVERFYLHGGLRRLYAKNVMSRRLKS